MRLRRRASLRRVLPGLSSIQLLAAALGRPWQDWKLVSAHGCACDPVAGVQCRYTDGFFLTGGSETPRHPVRKAERSGWGNVQGAVGENLGTAAERLPHGTAQNWRAGVCTASACCWWSLALPCAAACPGLPDEAFIRGKTPMTKQEVRAAALAKLAVRPATSLWDVGAGTGSVSVELALAAPAGRVYAVECDAGCLRADPSEPR